MLPKFDQSIKFLGGRGAIVNRVFVGASYSIA